LNLISLFRKLKTDCPDIQPDHALCPLCPAVLYYKGHKEDTTGTTIEPTKTK